MENQFLTDCKKKFEHVLDIFVKDIASLRTGRASPALVEDIEADYYGTKTPIKHMAAINVSGPTEILIQPWDKAALKPIEEAIQKSKLGINPIVNADGIRLSLPKLSQERREQLVKLLKEKAEEARIGLRKEREDTLRVVSRLFDEKKLGEDEKFRAKDDVQKLVDEFNKKIEETVVRKEGDIMTI
ncbi:MAG: ribosome recycling factor [bacterium]|nr:ribosome recycling factor [bacterium]